MSLRIFNWSTPIEEIGEKQDASTANHEKSMQKAEDPAFTLKTYVDTTASQQKTASEKIAKMIYG